MIDIIHHQTIEDARQYVQEDLNEMVKRLARDLREYINKHIQQKKTHKTKNVPNFFWAGIKIFHKSKQSAG